MLLNISSLDKRNEFVINFHFLNKHVGSGGGGGGAARFHSSNIFLKFTYRKLKQHGAAPSPPPPPPAHILGASKS